MAEPATHRGGLRAWILGQLGGALFGYILAPAIAFVLAAMAGILAAAKNAPTWLAALLGLVVFVVIGLILLILYTIRIGPWLARFKPKPPPYRKLGDRADFYSQQIMRFENRDPEGNPLPMPRGGRPPLNEMLDALSAQQDSRVAAEQARRSDLWTRFDDDHGEPIRRLFHDLRNADLVVDGEMPLFYTPRTTADRIALAYRLRNISFQARQLG
jgi:hypothetical protein